MEKLYVSTIQIRRKTLHLPKQMPSSLNPELNDMPGFAEAYMNEPRQELQTEFEQQRIQLRDVFCETFSL